MKNVIPLLLLVCYSLGAKNAFENANFEHGDFSNWETVQNWCLVSPDAYPYSGAVDAAGLRQSRLGDFGALNYTERGELVMARYEGDKPFQGERTLISRPFPVRGRYLAFHVFLRRVKNVTPQMEIGLDLNSDGRCEIVMSEAQTKRAFQGENRFFFDLKEHAGKPVRFVARVANAECALDNIRFQDAPPPVVKAGGARSYPDGRMDYVCRIANPFAEKTETVLTVRVRDYFNQVVLEERQQLELPAGGSRNVCFSWKQSCGRKYRVEVIQSSPDGDVWEHLTETVFPDSIADGRSAVRISPQNWRMTDTTDKKLELPAQNAAWRNQAPFRSSKSFFWRDSLWKPRKEIAQQFFEKKINIPASFIQERNRIILNFDAGGAGPVAIFVNGKLVVPDYHLYPYVRTELDLTDVMAPGENTLLLRFRNALHFTPGDMEKKWFEYPVFQHNHTPMSGILGNLYLESRPAVSIRHCYIDSWMEPERIKVRTEVVNRSAETQTAKLSFRMIDARRKTLAVLPDAEVVVAPGQKNMAESAGPVSGLPRWTPDTPDLLQMEITCRSATGTEIFRERFGFREFSYKGKQFLLNGHPVSILESLMQSNVFHGDWKKWWGANAIRRCACPEQLDAADEEGYFQRMVQEHIYPGTVTPNPAVLPESYVAPFSKMELDMVDYHYNHPSVYMWNLGNELDGHGYFRQQTYEYYSRLFGGIAEKIYALDPQRPCSGSGDAIAPFFRKRAWSVHYPYEYSIAHDLPNSARLLSEKLPLHVLAPNMPYDGKPVFCGENFSESGVGSYLAAFGGDLPDRMSNWFAVWRDFFRIRSREMRLDGISAQAPFTPIITLRNYYPVDVFPAEYRTQFYAGEKLKLPVGIIHDNFKKEVLELRWQIGARSGIVPVKLEPGERRIIELPEIDLPEKACDVPYQLHLWQDGKPMLRWGISKGTLTIVPRVDGKRQKVGVIGEEKAVGRMLDGYRFLPIRVAEKELSGEFPMVIADSAAIQDTGALENYVRNGGKLLIQLTRNGEFKFHGNTLQVMSHRDTKTFVIAPHDPLMNNLPDRLMRYWRDNDFRVMDRAIIRPEQADRRSLCLSGDADGLRLTPLVRETIGKGVVVYTTLCMQEAWQKIPAAGVLLANLAQYSNPISVRPAAALLRDPWQNMLKKNGCNVVDLATAAAPEKSMADCSLLLVEATAKNVDVQALETFVRAGGTLVLWRMTPEALAQWKHILPAGVALAKSPSGCKGAQAYKCADSPLLDGLANNDFSWLRGKIMYIGGGLDMRSAITALSDYTYQLPARTEVQPLTEPVALAVMRLGKGRVILDQVRWYEAAKESPQVLRSSLLWYANLGLDCAGKRDQSVEVAESLSLPFNYRGEMNALGLKHADKFFQGPRKKANGAIILGTKENFSGNPRRVSIKTGDRKISKLNVVSANAFGYIDYSVGQPYARIICHYADGSETRFQLVYGLHGDDIRVVSAGSLGEARQIAAMEQDGCSAYRMSWKNPTPGVAIHSISIESADEKIVPVIFSVEMELAARSERIADRRRVGKWSIAKYDSTEENSGARIWAVGGPFPNQWQGSVEDCPEAFHQAYPPELSVDLKRSLKLGLGKQGKWQRYVENFNTAAPNPFYLMDPMGILDFTGMPRDRFVAYFFTKVYSPTAQRAVIAFGSDDAGKIFFNGKEIHANWVLRGVHLGDDRIEVQLQKGWNSFLLKLVQMRLGVGIAFDLKPYRPDFRKMNRDEFGKLPSLVLRYDAYAGQTEVDNAVRMTECGKEKYLPALLDGSGIEKELESDGSPIFVFDYECAGQQTLTTVYKQFLQSGDFRSGTFSMDFLIPAGKCPNQKAFLAVRNAGGYHPGDVFVELHSRNGQPDFLRLGAEIEDRGNGKFRKWDMPLKKIFPKGFPYDRFLPLTIRWGKGVKVTCDGQTLLDDPSCTERFFSSATAIHLGGSAAMQGQIKIKNVVLDENSDRK